MTVLEATPAMTAPEQRRLMGSAYDLSGATDVASARSLAGLDWEAVHRPLYVDLPDDGGLAPVEKERAVVRSDNGEMFGVVGREHQIVTNAEFFDIADVLMSEADTTWATSSPFGGARGKGKAPFLAFQLGEGIQVAGQDAVDTAVLLNNGHVGNTALTFNVLPIRCKCSNVVSAALKAGRAGQNLFSMSIQHSGDMAAKVAAAREALALTSVYMQEFNALADRMAAVDFGLAEFSDMLTELVPCADDAGDRAKATAEAQRATFRQNWKDTLTLDSGLKSTAWGALNVITEVIDHGNLDVRKSKVPAAERRLQAVHFGTGAALRNRAYGLLAGI
jgi:phage/plasmid-like protein (TIGR03299 family)